MTFDHIQMFLKRHKDLVRTPGIEIRLTHKDATGLAAELAFLLASYQKETVEKVPDVIQIKVDGKR